MACLPDCSCDDIVIKLIEKHLFVPIRIRPGKDTALPGIDGGFPCRVIIQRIIGDSERIQACFSVSAGVLPIPLGTGTGLGKRDIPCQNYGNFD